MVADEPSDETIVETAADAAESVVFSAYSRSTVRDVDVTVTFEDGVLDVDVYLNVPAEEPSAERVVDEAAIAARRAVDDLFDA